jgi:hypothetical protein
MKRLALLSVLFFALVSAPVFAGSPWWDDRLDGVPVPGFDGLVIYGLEVLEAPISFPPMYGFYPGRVEADPSSFTFTDWYGNSYTGSYHADTGCYLSSDVPGDVVQAFCYDGGTGFFMLYGTLEWNGAQGVITGPWEFVVVGEAYSGPMFRPETVHVE